MSLNDPLANALSAVLHSESIGRTECAIKPVSRMIKQVFKILNEQHYLGSYAEVKDRKGNHLKVQLTGAINQCGVVKPRFPVTKEGFEKLERRYLPARNMGLLIVSTSKGLMTNSQAKEKKLGGRIIAYCY